jgi:hypothetical protein
MDPANWRFDRELHAQVIPSEHPELVAALERLWASEIGDNCTAAALAMGVVPALKMAMGAAVTHVLVNEDFSRFATRRPRTTPSGLHVAGAGTTAEDLSEVARALEGLRERHDHRPNRPPR